MRNTMSREEFDGSVRSPSCRSREQSPCSGAPSVPMRMRRIGTGRGAWLIFLATAAILILVCLGGIVYCVAISRGRGRRNPTTIEAVRNEMAELNLPSGYLPAVYGRLGEFRGVAYVNPETDGRIQLFEDATKMHDAKIETRKSSAGQPVHPQPTTDPLLNVKSHIRQLRIKGKECTFEFSQGIDPETRQARRRVSGTFAGKGGPTTIEVEMDASAYNEGQIVKMLEGIR